MATITQNRAGDPADLFFSARFTMGTEANFQTPTSFYWSTASMYDEDLMVWGGGVIVEGRGFTYSGTHLASVQKVTSLKVVSSYGPGQYDGTGAVTISGLSLSFADTINLLQGNSDRLQNIIATTQWKYEGSAFDDVFTSGMRNDRLNGGDGSDRLDGGKGNDVIKGGAGIDTLLGGSGNDKLYGGAGGDLLYGGKGNDVFYVDSNSDRVRETAGEGHDTVYASDDFTLFTSAAIEVLRVQDVKVVATVNLTGNDFAQKIIGGAGNNVIDGKGGADILNGGKGDDVLTGGLGRDKFVFATKSGRDEITDFSDGDRIDVRNWKGIDNFADVKAHATNHDADVWIKVGHDTLIIDNLHKADLRAGDFLF